MSELGTPPQSGEHMHVKVLTRRYSDNSGFEVVRVYVNEPDRADSDLALVKDSCMWTYELHDVLAIGQWPKSAYV